MARRPSLTDAGVSRPAQAAPAAEVLDAGAQSRRPAARQGLKAVAFWVPPEAALQLRIASATHGRPIQALMSEALDDWFAKHGLNRLAGAGRQDAA
jgi:hypothetical protein